jgi:hypothetical protein
MIGLFQGHIIEVYILQCPDVLRSENGPCQVNPDGKTTTLNPFRSVVFSIDLETLGAVVFLLSSVY